MLLLDLNCLFVSHNKAIGEEETAPIQTFQQQGPRMLQKEMQIKKVKIQSIEMTK